MRKIIKCGLLLFIVLILPAVVINAESVVEVEEGVYQVEVDGEQSYIEFGDGIESTVNESGSGFNNGEDNNSGSGDEQASEEGNNSSDASEATTAQQYDTSSSDDVLDKLEVINKDVIETKETIFKIMISIWVLAGLFIGVKLIKEMFGYG